MRIKGLKVFITGGLGFIGSNVANRLVTEGVRVKIYDNFSSGNTENIKNFSHQIEVIKGDILNKEFLQKSMKGADLVSHHAAQLEITTAVKDPYGDLEVNTVGTLNVLEGCVKNNVKKLINASSACVYGQKSGRPTKEGDQTNPNWAYGVSKLASEKYCRIYSELYGLPNVSFRYSIVYGENEWYGRVMTIFIKRALQRKSLVVFGTGKQKRDYIHVQDAVEANIKAIQKDSLKSEIFNVSTGVSTSIESLARKINKITGNNVDIIYDKKVKEGDKSKYIKRMRLPSELQNMVLSKRKMEKILRTSLSMNLEKGLERQINWARENPYRWKTMSY